MPETLERERDSLRHPNAWGTRERENHLLSPICQISQSFTETPKKTNSIWSVTPWSRGKQKLENKTGKIRFPELRVLSACPRGAKCPPHRRMLRSNDEKVTFWREMQNKRDQEKKWKNALRAIFSFFSWSLLRAKNWERNFAKLDGGAYLQMGSRGPDQGCFQ